MSVVVYNPVREDGTYKELAPDAGLASFHIRRVIDPRIDFEDLSTIDKNILAILAHKIGIGIQRLLLIGMILILNGHHSPRMVQVL